MQALLPCLLLVGGGTALEGTSALVLRDAAHLHLRVVYVTHSSLNVTAADQYTFHLSFGIMSLTTVLWFQGYKGSPDG